MLRRFATAATFPVHVAQNICVFIRLSRNSGCLLSFHGLSVQNTSTTTAAATTTTSHHVNWKHTTTTAAAATAVCREGFIEAVRWTVLTPSTFWVLCLVWASKWIRFSSRRVRLAVHAGRWHRSKCKKAHGSAPAPYFGLEQGSHSTGASAAQLIPRGWTFSFSDFLCWYLWQPAGHVPAGYSAKESGTVAATATAALAGTSPTISSVPLPSFDSSEVGTSVSLHILLLCLLSARGEPSHLLLGPSPSLSRRHPQCWGERWVRGSVG